MKNLYILIVCLFTATIVSGQEKLSKEEMARREKNIQAANPFAKLGSKTKVATLSNGKYLEVQDLDSIVTIGTIRFHVESGKIVGVIQQDVVDPDAQPIGDTPSRWINVDPLTEEFPSWSPYNYCYDNPMKYTDPKGMAPQDIIVLNNPKGAGGFGHMAMLVGDDKKGWTFISKEGRDKGPLYSNEITGGPALKPLIKEYKTLGEFRDAQKEDKNLGGYTQDVRLDTNETQDQQAKEATTDSADDWYNVAVANCADAVSDGLSAAGLDPGYTINPEGKQGLTGNSLDPRPNERFQKIIENNKKVEIPTDSVPRQ